MPQNQDENNREKLANTAFISEKIKQRPINRKKLLMRTVITISLAVIFGIVACFTFLFLQPVFSDKLYPEKEPETVSFPEESASDELTPEEMFADDSEIAAVEAMSLEESQKDQIDQAIAAYAFSSADYSKMMASLKSVANEASRSIVQVTSITNDANWFNSSFESSGSTSGLIVADSGNYYYILVHADVVSDAESINVTFCDNKSAEAEIKLSDSVTGLCVLTVRKSSMTAETRSKIAIAVLGSSNTSSFTGLPVIAIGNPIGIQGSISYGIVTSEKTTLDLVDTAYKLITTDINGSSYGSGAIINLRGQVIGIIDMAHRPQDLSDNICAIGITELKPLIENLSNGKERAYLGIHGSSVPMEVQQSQNIPAGAYVIKTEMGSPAMKAGIQSGDIIKAIGSDEILTYEQLINRLAQFSPDDIITVTVRRQAPTDYIDMEIEVTLSGSATE
ncbi:MAG: PDZ domain-containing protein [Butyrivibrio sp.]|nr:PDZ domain-containing protein [Butyrivibrio sp.]